jgi:hypothetical protein
MSSWFEWPDFNTIPGMVLYSLLAYLAIHLISWFAEPTLKEIMDDKNPGLVTFRDHIEIIRLNSQSSCLDWQKLSILAT